MIENRAAYLAEENPTRANGSSHHGIQVCATAARLKRLLGAPQFSTVESDGNTVLEWNLTDRDGFFLSLYNWHTDVSDEDRPVFWHIASHGSRTAEEKLRDYIEEDDPE